MGCDASQYFFNILTDKLGQEIQPGEMFMLLTPSSGWRCIQYDGGGMAPASSSTGVLLKAGETWETNWPIDIQSNISAIASGSSTQIYGVVWGVHQG